MKYDYVEYATNKTLEVLAIDSPTGYTQNAAKWLIEQLTALGFKAVQTNKGGVMADFGGEGNALMLSAHIDTLGGMVAEIKGNGRLRLTRLGGLAANNCEAENVTVYTRDGKKYSGTFQLCNASLHVNGDYADTKRTFDTCEVVIDEDVFCAGDTQKLGIAVGDIVAFNPKSTVTESGYIKSRFLDDKLSVGILLALAKYIADNHIKLGRKVYCHFTVFEEVGHGCSASCPASVTEILSVDMGCVGNGLTCTEKRVSICAKDNGGPYNYDMVTRLINAAKAQNADYAVDVYPHYGSDADAALVAGADARHALIGAGVYASHGYERSHKEGVYNTLKTLVGFLNI